MPKERYTIAETQSNTVLIRELNRVLNRISERLNYLDFSEKNTSLSNQKIVNLAEGTNDTDAVRKSQLPDEFSENIIPRNVLIPPDSNGQQNFNPNLISSLARLETRLSEIESKTSEFLFNRVAVSNLIARLSTVESGTFFLPTNRDNDLSAAWPVGSIFLSHTTDNPATLLGFGTWSRIAAGRFLACYESGGTFTPIGDESGGDHHHNTDIASFTSGGPSSTTTVDKNEDGVTVEVPVYNHNHSVNPPSTQSDVQDNYPPYYVINAWRRTA